MINVNKKNIYKIEIDKNTKEGLSQVFGIFNKIEFNDKKHNSEYILLLRFKAYFSGLPSPNEEKIIQKEIRAIKKFYRKLNKKNVLINDNELSFVCGFIGNIIRNNDTKQEFYHSMFLNEDEISIIENNIKYLKELYSNLQIINEDILFKDFLNKSPSFKKLYNSLLD